jgi:hypothetical protein
MLNLYVDGAEIEAAVKAKLKRGRSPAEKAAIDAAKFDVFTDHSQRPGSKTFYGYLKTPVGAAAKI